jgi:hypothetical protein
MNDIASTFVSSEAAGTQVIHRPEKIKATHNKVRPKAGE